MNNLNINTQNLPKLIAQIEDASHSLHHENGLYSASKGEHYVSYCWLRDLYFQTLDIERTLYLQSWTTFLDFLVKCESKYSKLSSIVKHGRDALPLHIRWGTECNDEVESEWGMLQADAWGMALMAIAKEADYFLSIPKYRAVVGLFIETIHSYEYWTMRSCDAWEEGHEHRLSGIACCTSGVYDIAPYFPELSDKTDEMLKESKWIIADFGSNETVTREVDMAQLYAVSFAVPRGIMSGQQGYDIISKVEFHLLRRNGVIRYEEDTFYNINSTITRDRYNGVFNPQKEGMLKGGEASWTMGLPALIMARQACGLSVPLEYYESMLRITKMMKGEIPELFYADTDIHNDNEVLGWSCNLYKIVLSQLL